MPFQNVEERRAYIRDWYQRNKERESLRKKQDRKLNPEKYRSWTRRYKNANREAMRSAHAKRRSLADAFIDAAKASGCVDCGNKNLGVLELDHVRGKKVNSIARLKWMSLPKLFAEIAKCEPRCANCHRLVTISRRRQLSAAKI